MRVKCINNVEDYYTLCLTKGEMYEVLEERSNSYIIKNDNNILGAYRKSNFEKVDEKEKVLEVEFQDVFDEVAWRIVYKNEDIINMWKSKGKDNEDDFKWILTLELFSNFGIHVSTKEEAESIKQKVDVINDKYGIPKKWRAKKGEVYYYIDSDGTVIAKEECGTTTDDRRYKFGNYAKTKKELEFDKLEKIKQIFAE